MKIFALPTLAEDAKLPVYDAIADSSLSPWRKPFYLPDFDTRFTMSVCPLVVLSRLGKTIPERFASGYYSDGMMGIVFRAADMYTELTERGLPSALALSFDHSVLASPKMPIDELSRIWREGVTVSINDNPVAKIDVDVRAQSDTAIHLLSRYTTMKMGDVLCLSHPTEGIRISEADKITITETPTGRLIHSFTIK